MHTHVPIGKIPCEEMPRNELQGTHICPGDALQSFQGIVACVHYVLKHSLGFFMFFFTTTKFYNKN